MRLFVDLSAQEESDLHGWVNMGLADPSFADHPYRIVLSERTRARFEQIAAQFASPPTGPVTPPPPTGEVDVQGIYHPYDAPVVFTLAPGHIVAFPLAVPGGVYATTNELYASAAEYSSDPALLQAAINITAGDLTGFSQGAQATVSCVVKPDNKIKPGSIAYYNVRLAEGFPLTRCRFSAGFPR